MVTSTEETVRLTKLGATLADRIGNTPLLRLERLVAHLPGITLLGKAEWVNPGARSRTGRLPELWERRWSAGFST